MKLINTLVIAGSLLTLQASAQVKLGVQGGLNISSPNLSGLANEKNVSKPFGGVVAQFDLGGFYFRPSINYLQNQVNSVVTNSLPAQIGIPNSIPSTQTINTNRTFQNFEIPLDLVLPIKYKTGKFLIAVAPTVTVGFKAAQTVGTTTTATTTGGSPTVTTQPSVNLNYGNNPLEVKKVDWGTRFGLGYEFKGGLQLNAGYKLGLTNLSNSSTSLKQHNVMLTAAYFLFKSK